ncbi:MAG: RHS repeat-associated core domain-containing protein, partial [Bryobacteraceae bacterium]
NSDNTTVAGPKYSYTYDSMERLAGMTDQANTALVSSAGYGPSNELLQLTANSFTETRVYNANLELIDLTSGSGVHYKYNYSGTQDNGQILSQNDLVSGETITYQYDTLQRLIQAGATGDPSGPWSQAFGYDGFGNLSQIAPNNAPALSVAVDPATNRLQSFASYDTNGNMVAYAGDGYAYDLQNRMIQASPASGGTVVYGYDSTNRRIYKAAYSSGNYSAEEIYFYGADGHKYGTWQIDPSSGVLLKASVTKQWFGSRLLSPQDRLDSRGRYFPFGQERTNVNPPNPANDQEKFASYTRDSFTGLDYANQRYYNSMIDRFLQPDPFRGSANLNVPQSWNRYAYAGNDPANNFDPEGLAITNLGDYQDYLGFVSTAPTYVYAYAPPPLFYATPTPVYLSSTGGSGGGGGGAPPSTGMPPPPPVPPPNCSEQLQAMMNLIYAVRPSGTSAYKGLAQLFNQIGRMSMGARAGHNIQFLNRQRQLQRMINNYRNSGCGEPPSDVMDWATRPAPGGTVRPGVNYVIVSGAVLAIGATAILAPELFPVLIPVLVP